MAYSYIINVYIFRLVTQFQNNPRAENGLENPK
jgi:hypothetical protein